MKRHVDKSTRFKSKLLERRACSRLRKVCCQSVDHDVSDTLDFRLGNSLAQQIFVRISRWREEAIRDGVGNNPVYLFGHGAVEATESSLNVSRPEVEFCTHQSAGHCGVNV